MRVSDINLEIVKQYLRIDGDEDNSELQIHIDSAKSYLKSYTGLSEEEIDEQEYFTGPVLMLISELYENKTTQGSKFANRIYDAMLNLGSKYSL